MTDLQPIAKPDDLPYQLACDAYRNTSFHPEERARRDQQSYAEDVNGLHAELLALAARVHLAEHRWEKAIDSAVESLSLVYVQPWLHHLLGVALAHLNERQKDRNR